MGHFKHNQYSRDRRPDHRAPAGTHAHNGQGQLVRRAHGHGQISKTGKANAAHAAQKKRRRKDSRRTRPNHSRRTWPSFVASGSAGIYQSSVWPSIRPEVHRNRTQTPSGRSRQRLTHPTPQVHEAAQTGTNPIGNQGKLSTGLLRSERVPLWKTDTHQG